MKVSCCFVVLSLFLCVRELFLSAGKIIHCYYPRWAYLHRGEAQLLPEKIDPTLCTHITFAFAKLDGKKFLISSENPQIDYDLYYRLTNLKFKNPKLKILLGVGGFADSNWENKENNKYAELVENPVRRQRFINHTVHFLKYFAFDGLDFQWEFPAIDDKFHLVNFLRDCKRKFSRFRLLLFFNLPASPILIHIYDMDTINRNVDFVVLMTHEFHSYYEGATNYISKLTSDHDYSVHEKVRMYKDAGLLSQKILIGVATYAKSYQLIREDMHDIGSPAVGPGKEGPLTHIKGYLSYPEVCKNDWRHVFDLTGRKGAYAYFHLQWAAYNDKIAIKAKAEYAMKENLAGVSFWSLPQDDFSGKTCRDGEFPLISTAKKVFLKHNESDLEVSERNSQNPVDRCVTEGYFRDFNNCNMFFECKNGILRNISCGELFWNQTCFCCVLSNAHCNNFLTV